MIEWIIEQVQLLASLGFIFFGIFSFTLLSKPRTNKIKTMLLGAVLVLIGLFIFPQEKYQNEQEIYYRN